MQVAEILCARGNTMKKASSIRVIAAWEPGAVQLECSVPLGTWNFRIFQTRIFVDTHSRMAAVSQKNECDFYKALSTIRGKDGKTKGIACAVDVDGKKKKDEVVLVTWKGCIGEGQNSLKKVHRHRRKLKFRRNTNGKHYQLEPSDDGILKRGNFSLIRCASGSNNDKWGVRLSLRCLKEEEQKTNLKAYTIHGDSYRPLTLTYDESTNKHHLGINKLDQYANLMLQGAPIIENEEYLVGVLKDEEGICSPLFIKEGELGEWH